MLHSPRRPAGAARGAAMLAASLLALVAVAPTATAQQPASPVYVDDSPAAVEGLARASEQIRAGDLERGIRLIQRMMDEEGHRLLASERDPNLFGTVRRRIHDLLLADPTALEAYRTVMGPGADRLLEDGDVEGVESRYLLTGAGFEAALQVAQRRIERAAFESARITLEQLERHPDRRGPAGRDAAALLAEANRYLRKDAVAARVERWRREAGLETPLPSDISGPTMRDGHSVWSDGPDIALEDVVAQPFWSAAMTLPRESTPGPRGRSDSEDSEANTRLLHIAPTVAGDSIYINDGQSISAWDRFTMSLRWRVEVAPIPSGLRNRSVGRLMLEDINSVTVEGPWAIATTGLARQGGRVGDDRTHAIDARTGEAQWSVKVASLTPSLADSDVRGPAVVDQGLAILRADKQVKQRRLMSVHLAGLDLGSGRLAWETTLGSRGTLPYATNGQTSEPLIVRDGLVYIASRLGFAAAVEAATGRVRWLRRFEFESTAQVTQRAWQAQSSALIEDQLFTIAPDLGEITRIDAATGEITARRPASVFGRPRYLLSSGDTLLAVGERTVFAIDRARFDEVDTPARMILNAGNDGIWGRAVVAGSRILAPTTDGMLAAGVDAQDGVRPEFIELEKPGNLIAAEGQIVVVDDLETHSYLIWPVAEEILGRRMEMNPSDPTPAMTYAELAHRAGRYERILPALDKALSAIEQAPLDPRNKRVRARLFESVARMTDPDPDADKQPDLSDELRGEILLRQQRLASTPPERVRHLLAEGAHLEQIGAPGDAVDAYQRILIEQPLADARLERHDVTIHAEVEATKRVRRLLRMFGRELYAAYDAEAARELEDIEGAMNPDQFTQIARRYPVARAAAESWLAASDAYRKRSQPHGAIRALEEGLIVARLALDSDDPLLGELAGRLVKLLERQGRFAAASAAIARIRDRWPELVFTDDGSPIDVASLNEQISDRLASLRRRPAIGLLEDEPGVELLRGYVVADPLIKRRAAASSEFIVLVGPDEFALFGIDSLSGVRKIWSVPADETTSLLALTEGSVLFADSGERGVSVSSFELATGKRQWRTQPFDAMLPGDRARGEGEAQDTLRTSTQGERPLSELLAAMDDRTIVLIERSGRGLALDLESGRTLWTKTDIARAVHDIATRAGQLLVGGASARRPDPETGAPPRPVLSLFDLRTGEPLQQLPAENGLIRWVRLTPEGAAIAGMDGAVASFDLFHGRMRWIVSGEPGRRTVDAWLFPERLITLTEAGSLWQIDLEDGRSTPDPLEARGRVASDTGIIASASLNGRSAFATDAGIVVFDEAGNLAGLDQRSGYATLVPAVFAEDHIITIDSSDAARFESESRYELMILSAESARMLQRREIALGSDPHTLGLLSGRILVSAGDSTVVLDALPD